MCINHAFEAIVLPVTSPQALRSERKQSKQLHKGWLLVLASLTGMGAVAGGALATKMPVTHTAELRLAIGTSDLSAQAQSGYALGTQQLASNYARYINNSVKTQQLSSKETTAFIQASPIPESNVVRIEATGESAEASLAAVKTAANDLTATLEKVRASNKADEVLQRVDASAAELAKKRAQVQQAERKLNILLSKESSAASIAAARAKVVELSQEVSVLQVKHNADSGLYQEMVRQSLAEAVVTNVTEAHISANSASSNIQKGSIAGAGAVGLLGLLLVPWRTTKRPTRQQRTRTGQFTGQHQTQPAAAPEGRVEFDHNPTPSPAHNTPAAHAAPPAYAPGHADPAHVTPAPLAPAAASAPPSGLPPLVQPGASPHPVEPPAVASLRSPASNVAPIKLLPPLTEGNEQATPEHATVSPLYADRVPHDSPRRKTDLSSRKLG